LKIVFFRHSLLSRGGDKMIVVHASNLAAKGHEVVIKTNQLRTVFELDDRIRVEPLKYPGKLGTLASALVEKHRADLVIADIIPLACLLAIRNRTRTLYFAQDYDESYYASWIQKFFIRILYFIGLRVLKCQAVAVADHLAATFRQRFGAGSIVVENGVDTSIFYHDPDPELLAAKGGRRALLLFSRSDPRKGFDLAAQVVANLLQQSEQFEIWTVGEACVDQFLAREHRDFGYVDENRLRRIMSSADLFLYPTRHEGFPLMVLEAFACRCPVVTTTAVPYARHEENALVASIGDVAGLAGLVSELLSDERLRQSITVQGSRFAADHSLDMSKLSFEATLNSFCRKDAAAEWKTCGKI
jgi:glycosyltransferase involved in cell wall biosynthesis